MAGYRWHSGDLLVRFAEISDRTAAAELGGTWLLVDSAALGALDDPDEFRDGDLVGLTRAHGRRHRRGNRRPTCSTTARTSSPSTRPARLPARPGEQILIPFVKAIVPEVDIAGGVLVIDPPEGLLNLQDAT